ncbi:hypothetical protein D3C73_1262920 [compost metagenome]
MSDYWFRTGGIYSSNLCCPCGYETSGIYRYCTGGAVDTNNRSGQFSGISKRDYRSSYDGRLTGTS